MPSIVSTHGGLEYANGLEAFERFTEPFPQIALLARALELDLTFRPPVTVQRVVGADANAGDVGRGIARDL